MEEQTMSGKTVEEAIEVALKELDANRAEVEIEILSHGKPGFLGIGAEPARVHVRRLPASQKAASQAMEVVGKMLSLAGVRVLVNPAKRPRP